jgi:flagellin
LQTTSSEGRVDYALQQVLAAQAQLGAQSVSLSEASNNNQIGSLNLTASESEIRDLNVGQATTQFTMDQILVSVGTSVLSQMEVNTKQLTSLLIASLNAA